MIKSDNLQTKWLGQYEQKEINALAEVALYKWKDGYTCRKCGHNKYYEGRTPSSRKCQNMKCKKDESATANTVFDRLRMPTSMALELIKMACNHSKRYSINELSVNLQESLGGNVKPKAIWELMMKVYDRMEYQQIQLDGDVLIIYISDIVVATGLYNGKKSFIAKIRMSVEWFVKNYVSKDAAVGAYDMDEFRSLRKLKYRALIKTDRQKTEFPPEVIDEFLADFRYIYYDVHNRNYPERMQAYLNLYTFIKNDGTYEELRPYLTKSYERNHKLY